MKKTIITFILALSLATNVLIGGSDTLAQKPSTVPAQIQVSEDTMPRGIERASRDYQRKILDHRKAQAKERARLIRLRAEQKRRARAARLARIAHQRKVAAHLAHVRAVKREAARQAARRRAAHRAAARKVVTQRHHRTRHSAPTGHAPAGIASCIAHWESRGDPHAQNPRSSASGLYQFVDGTWGGFGGYRHAKDAPVSVQTQRFYQIWDGGRGASQWVTAHHCGY